MSVEASMTLFANGINDVSPNRCVAVLHIGFDRPPSQRFRTVAAKQQGRMLLTAPAKHALPREFVRLQELDCCCGRHRGVFGVAWMGIRN